MATSILQVLLVSKQQLNQVHFRARSTQSWLVHPKNVAIDMPVVAHSNLSSHVLILQAIGWFCGMIEVDRQVI